MKPRDYHNEIDPYAAQWTRNLMKKGLIPDGFVDERDIRDVQPMDLWGFTRCHFFSGSGGWVMALRLAGAPDDLPLWTGSCPCQPFSVAGQQKGFADERHLWPVWQKLIAQSRPAIVFGEQVAGASAWLRLVRSDLETMGYAVGAIPVEAASAGAHHLRDRFWFVAYGESEQARPARQPRQCGDVDDAARLTEREPIDQADTGASGGQTRRISLGASSTGTLADDDDDARLQGRVLQSERADQQPAGPDGVADTYGTSRRKDAGGPLSYEEADGRARRNFLLSYGDYRSASDGESDLNMADATSTRSILAAQPRICRGEESTRPRNVDAERLDWVVGADGKSRRVKPGIRLLAHGVPARASKLRAYGNAIDLRPAAAFIEAALSCRP